MSITQQNVSCLILLSAFLYKDKNNIRNDGARASAALVHLHQGPRPLDPFRRNYRFGRENCFRQFRWGYGKFVGFWPKESKENPEGESELSPSGFPLLSPDALHPGWRLRRRARSHNGTLPGILPINSGRLFSRLVKIFPPMRVQGDHPPGQVWAESPAQPLCLPFD